MTTHAHTHTHTHTHTLLRTVFSYSLSTMESFQWAGAVQGAENFFSWLQTVIWPSLAFFFFSHLPQSYYYSFIIFIFWAPYKTHKSKILQSLRRLYDPVFTYLGTNKSSVAVLESVGLRGHKSPRGALLPALVTIVLHLIWRQQQMSSHVVTGWICLT